MTRARLRPVGGTAAAGLVVVMLMIAVSSNVAFAMGVLGPQLRADLGVNRTALGVLSSAFFAATGVASVAAGRLVAAFGPRPTAVVALLLEGVVCAVAGITGRYHPLLVATVLAGAGYAVVNVAGNRIVRSISDDAHLGRYMSVKTAGVPLATTAVAVVSGLTVRWGWRPIIVGIGVCAGLVGLAAACVLAPTGAAHAAARRGRDRLAPSFLLLPLAGFCFIGGSQPLYSWLPSYLHESLGMAVGVAAVVTGAASGIGVPAMIGVARLADHLGGAQRARFIGGLCAATGSALVLVLLSARVGVGVAVVGFVVGVSANLAVAGLFPALIVEYAPHALERGTGVAMTGYFFGALASPVGFGALADLSGGYLLPWAACVGLLATGTVLCLLIQALVPRGTTPERGRQIRPADGRAVSSPARDG